MLPSTQIPSLKVHPNYEEEIEEAEPEGPDENKIKEPMLRTDREREILELTWAGYKNKEIGQRLKISVKTVEAHRANMMRKKGVSNVAELLKMAIQDGTLRIP